METALAKRTGQAGAQSADPDLTARRSRQRHAALAYQATRHVSETSSAPNINPPPPNRKVLLPNIAYAAMSKTMVHPALSAINWPLEPLLDHALAV